MSTDSAGLTDEVAVALNGRAQPQASSIPDRPADGASHEKWAAYVVALGAHPDTVAAMKRDELVAFAGRLGG